MTDLQQAETWLTEQADALVEQSIYTRPEDGRLMHLLSPVDRGMYQAMFLRDFVYKVVSQPDRFAKATTADTFDLFFEHMSADFVPPEYIHRDGRIEYWCFGPGPLTDSPAALVQGVLAYCRAADDMDYLKKRVDLMVKTLTHTRRHPVSGLIWVNPMMPYSPYGYTDTIQKTGEELISSVMLYDACLQLAPVLDTIDRGKDAGTLRAMANQIQLGMEGLYDPESGLYFAASYHCRQPDIWGSALAVSTKAAGKRSGQVAQALVDMYDKIVWHGQVRHLPAPMLWEKRLSEAREFRKDFFNGGFYAHGQETRYWSDDEPNTYQNGAYWATPVGWFVSAIVGADRSLAEKTLIDLVTFFRKEGIWECTHPSGHRKERDYTISAVMPLEGFRAVRSN
jgi:hypothetical protein